MTIASAMLSSANLQEMCALFQFRNSAPMLLKRSVILSYFECRIIDIETAVQCIRVAEHSTRKMLIEELLNRSRLEKLLRDSYGNYCVQVGAYSRCKDHLLMTPRLHLTTRSLPNAPFLLRVSVRYSPLFAILPTVNVFKTSSNASK